MILSDEDFEKDEEFLEEDCYLGENSPDIHAIKNIEKSDLDNKKEEEENLSLLLLPSSYPEESENNVSNVFIKLWGRKTT